MEPTLPIVKFKLKSINLIALILFILIFTLIILDHEKVLPITNEKYRNIFVVIVMISILAIWILPLAFKNYNEIGR
jgi:hypothetical protein